MAKSGKSTKRIHHPKSTNESPLKLPQPFDDILATIDRSRPILLVDADEVLLRFVERLSAYFITQGFELRLTSFQLAGNTYHIKSGKQAEAKEVKHLIASFFDACVDDIAAVAGAADALKELSSTFQIIILSNVPRNCRARRMQSLSDQGMPYPVIANKGEKGPAVKAFATATDKITVFVDDLPPQHKSVKAECPESHRVHFIADSRLAEMIGKAPAADIRIDNWPLLTKHLLEIAKD
ncbi:MAG: hypothetical protein COB37_11185 [Kordiimonadales bacterium]|nr:MAG: hypothetical protein COB37_11185 [Kordiimonadales bacterium]